MARGRSIAVLAAAGLVAIFTLHATLAGQSAPQPNQDTLTALLSEVRSLRIAMEQMASAGPRVQLAMGRLQLQEQRVNTLARRADSIRDQIASARNELANFQEHSARMQHLLEQNTAPPEERSAIELQFKETKQRISRSTTEIQRLQVEEADASTEVANEQARWVEINQRLEELERALARR